jgi:hypothetical protein
MSTIGGDTPEAWDADEQIGKRAADWYDAKRAEFDTVENRDRYVIIDSDTGEHEIGDTEDDAERRFIARYGSDSRAVLFHIGHF